MIVVSLLAPNSHTTYRIVVQALAERSGLDLQWSEVSSWREQERMLYAGEAHVGLLCGVLYATHSDRLRLLGAPVMAAPRYEDRPVYFTDVVVRTDSRYQTFSDLRGASWAYNGFDSHSGYNVVASHLVHIGAAHGFFGHALESGAHQASLALVLAGEVHAAPIDSTVLDVELSQQPELAERIRVVATLGPTTIPPMVTSAAVGREEHEMLQQALMALPGAGPVARFVQVADSDYDVLRRMHAEASTVSL